MKHFSTIILLAAALTLTSCIGKYDNYDGPDATLQGAVTDLDGKPLNVESGGGIRIKLMEYGYSDNPKEQYLKVKMDGTYINTKIFSGTYDIVAEGPFVPLYQVDDKGDILVDKTEKNVRVKGTTTVNFKVEPFLRVELGGEPRFEKGVMTVDFNIKRGTSDPAWQLDVYDVGLFVSTTKYVGENNYDSRICVREEDKGKATAMIGKTSSLTTRDTYPMLPGHKYYVRVGARLDYAFSFGAGRLYNYSDVIEVVVPQY